jgi:hypothetical protein
MNLQRLMAHPDSTLHWLSSYFQYIGLGKFANAISVFQDGRTQPCSSLTGTEYCFSLCPSIPHQSSWTHDKNFPSLANSRQSVLQISTCSHSDTIQLHNHIFILYTIYIYQYKPYPFLFSYNHILYPWGAWDLPFLVKGILVGSMHPLIPQNTEETYTHIRLIKSLFFHWCIYLSWNAPIDVKLFEFLTNILS